MCVSRETCHISMQEKRRFDKVLIDSFDFEKNAKKKDALQAPICVSKQGEVNQLVLYILLAICAEFMHFL